VAVENRIIKVQKRNRALVRFDAARIFAAVMRAADSIGGFEQDRLCGINETIFEAWKSDEGITGFLTDAVVMLLNSNPHHLIANFPPTIETIQDAVLHVLRSYGFQNTADAYACYRWGRHWLREGAIRSDQFIGNGVPKAQMERSLEWSRSRGCGTVTDLNELVRGARLKPLVEESLALYERSLDDAASQILTRVDEGKTLRMIWISGPSCAGKTTTTLKLAQRLEGRGLRLVMLNLDDYFWSLVEHPTDWINDRNYETPEALDIQLLNQHLKTLLEGGLIQKPIFDFKEGRRLASKPVRLEKDQVLLLDCLHGLYPPMTEGIDPSIQFRLCLETQSAIQESDGNTHRLIGASDIRLLRRMLRDVRHRNHSPLRTLLHWHYVRTGELFSIMPLSGLADYTVNTGFVFELAILKAFFYGKRSHMPQPEDFAPYGGFLDARIRYHRISQLLDSVDGVPEELLTGYDMIPGDAVLREFIGGSTIAIPHNN
jgi:uridine kinase